MSENYQPADLDERGMWNDMERIEESVATSDALLKAPELQAYTVEVMDRLLGRPATDLRIYLVRNSDFNASMWPNGMMVVHTGFMARVRNEAQYAAVLGHEAGHYFRKHSIVGYRSRRKTAATMAFVNAGANLAAGYSATQGVDGRSWIDLANSINQALVASVFQYKRGQESEADAYGITLMARAGYSPIAAAQVWQQVIDEAKASAKGRDRRYKASSLQTYSTHPPDEERRDSLAETASVLREPPGRAYSDGAETWSRIIAPHLALLLEEQVKLNDPGGSLYLIEGLALNGWSGVLRYYEGEVYRLRNAEGDLARATTAYAEAVALPDAPAEAWRAHGYALTKAGRRDEGRQALARYLELNPDAKDAAIVRYSIAQ